MRLPSIQTLQQESDEMHLHDRVNKLENVIVRTIRQYDKVDFYHTYKRNIQQSKSTAGSSSNSEFPYRIVHRVLWKGRVITKRDSVLFPMRTMFQVIPRFMNP